jgi:hypothetical protein
MVLHKKEDFFLAISVMQNFNFKVTTCAFIGLLLASVVQLALIKI